MAAKMSAAAYSDQLELKCQERDLTILIGSEEQPYHYYSQFMAFGCELIDVMLSHDMKEKKDKVIRFPDISVDSWEKFQCYIYPNKDLEFSLHVADKGEKAMELLPLAAKFLKKDVCDHCDNVMANRLSLSDMLSFLCTYGDFFQRRNSACELDSKKVNFPRKMSSLPRLPSCGSGQKKMRVLSGKYW